MLESINMTLAFPAIAGLFLLLFFAYYLTVLRPRKGTLEWIGLEEKEPLRFSLKRHPVTKGDALPILLITAIYAVTAFLNLGDTKGISSFHRFETAGDSATIVLAEDRQLGSVTYFTGLWAGDYKLEVSSDGKTWYVQTDAENGFAMPQEYSNLFKWRTAFLLPQDAPVKYLRITAQQGPLELGEVAVYDSLGTKVSWYELSCEDAPALVDEQELVPQRESYLNSAYFDEIYHVRTAYEHLENVYPYEISHPPLGKLIIALGITLFGFNPFGWRFMGTLFGTLMLPVMYCFIKNLFGKRSAAVCGTLLLAFDFMHFTQTRIATIDSYGVFFILTMYWFFYRYLTVPKDAPFRKSVLPLFFSGLFFGLGAASKWIVLYGGAGLAVLWLLNVIFRMVDAVRENQVSKFGFWLMKTVAVCIPFFVVIPGVIYYLSYIPYGLASGLSLREGMLWSKHYWSIFLENQQFMFGYHSQLVSTHPYSSFWYQWISDARPILYYRSYSEDYLAKSAISSFGNPLVWWGGLLAMLCMLHRTIARRDGKALFILLGYLAQLLPWVFISRIVFIYHYFPSTVFLILAVSYVFSTVWERGSKGAVIAYTAAAGGLFAAFYPSISGAQVSVQYTENFLRWLPNSWPL